MGSRPSVTTTRPINRCETSSLGAGARSRHHTFFPAGIGVIEYLVNLDRLGRERVRFAALPLRLEGGDGAPARAIAILD